MSSCLLSFRDPALACWVQGVFRCPRSVPEEEGVELGASVLHITRKTAVADPRSGREAALTGPGGLGWVVPWGSGVRPGDWLGFGGTVCDSRVRCAHVNKKARETLALPLVAQYSRQTFSRSWSRIQPAETESLLFTF